MVGPQLEAVIDLGFHQDAAGFQSEGLVWIDGQPIQGIHPRRTGLPLPTIVAGPFDVLRRGGLEPGVPAVRAVAARRRWQRPATSRCTGCGRRRCACRDDTVLALLLDVDVLLGLATALAARRRSPHTGAGDSWRPRSTCSTSTTSATPPLRLVDSCEPALALRARAGAHRVVAVGHAHIDSAWLWPIRETQRKCARTFASAVRLMDDYPEYRFTLLAGRAVRVDRTRSPDAVRAHPRQGRRRPVAAGRRDVGRGRHEPAERREHRAPTGLRPALLRVEVRRCAARRSGSPTCSAIRRRCRRSSAQGGCTRFVTQKLSWNKQNRVPALDVLVAGPRRHAGAHPLPAGRHLQRRDHAGARCATPSATSRSTVGALVADAVRSRQRRRRTDAGDAGAGPADGRPRRRVAHHRRHAPTSSSIMSRPRSPPARRCPCGRASCTSRCTAAR